MRHTAGDLQQLQSLPLEAKIMMTQQRVRVWYESWWRFEIENLNTKKTYHKTFDMRGQIDSSPPIKENEYAVSGQEGAVYISFSGGKDSTVLKHIIDSMDLDIPALFVNTGLEYPEIQQFVRDIKAGKYDCFNPNVEIVRPSMRFDEVIKNYGYPIVSKEIADTVHGAKHYSGENVRLKKLRGELLDKDGNKSRFNCDNWAYLLDAPFEVSADCCRVMKKGPAKKYAKETGRMPIIATMASESRMRHQTWIKNGCNGFDAKRPISQPMAFWTEQDVLHYLKKFNVPYCSVYGDIQVKPQSEETLEGQINLIDYLEDYDPSDILETTGCDRTGCIFCGFGCHLEKGTNRFQRLKETHPKQYEYCINGGEFVDGQWQPNKDGLGIGRVLDYIGVKY